MEKTMYDSDLFFNTYIKNSDEKRLFVEHFSKRLEKGNAHKLLDLGCHDGTVTLEYLKAIPSTSNDITITCVDPSEPAIESFKKRKLPANMEFEFAAATAEDFLEANDAHYDWVVASHSLYWSHDLSKTIKGIVDAGDKAIIVLRNEIGLYQVQSKFKDIVGNKNEQFYNANDVESILEDIGATFQRENIVSKIEMPDRMSPIFPVLLAFFLQTDAAKFTPQQLDEINDYLKGLGTPLPHHVSFFWIGCN